MVTADPPPEPRRAATVVLLRESGEGLEVLMLRRHAAVEFAGDAWVFPGGTVEEADRGLPPERWRGIDPAALAPRFGDPARDVLGLHVAAVRETFEEAGLLLGVFPPRGGRASALPAGLAEARAASASGDPDAAGGFHAWLEAGGLVLDLGLLTYLSRWVTPPAYRKRFDAAFFLAPAPPNQVAGHDRVETTDGRWLRPAAALEAWEAGRFAMMHPTRRTLAWLAGCGGAAAAVERARAQPRVVPIRPRARRQRDGTVRLVDPGSAGGGTAGGQAGA